MKDSLEYRGFISWNMVIFNEQGLSQLKQTELKQRLKTKYYFKDFKFNLVSASNVRCRDENCI